MKSKSFISLIFMILFLALLSGCGNPSNDEEIMEYLNINFPNEKFEIINKEYVENVKSNCQSDNGDDKNEGHKYKIISNTTNIEFEINDIREESSYGTCEYSLKNNYYEQALTKYIIEFNDSRIKLDTHMSSSDIKVDYESFNSIDEISNVLYNFKIYYESKLPFSENANVDVYLYNSENYIGSLSLSNNNREITLNNINSKISELLQY